MSTSQTIFRAEHHSNYTPICNATLRDARLSPKARLVLTFAVGLPTDWKFTVVNLAKQIGIGKNAVSKAIDELIKFGYATQQKIRAANGTITEWITKFFERPNLELEPIVSRSLFSRSGSSRSGKQGDIQSKEETNYKSTKEIFNPPLTPQVEEGIKIDSFLGIKSNLHTLTTFRAMLKPLHNTISTLLDQPSAAAPPVEKPKINPPHLSVDNQAPIATAETLRKLSELTGESVETLRTNWGLQNALKTYPQNLEGVLAYLEIECKSLKPGIGLIINSLKEGRKPTKSGGSTWKEWADRAFAENLMSYSHADGNDILIAFRNGEFRLWSEVQKLSWEEVRLIAMEDAF